MPMPLYAWTMTLKEGSEEEYDRRHREIWPEMLALLHGAGIRQYSIFRDGRTVFGCFEAADEAAVRATIQASPVNTRWQQSMAPLVASQPDGPVGVTRRLARAWDMPPPR
jgi:L-rhamnose mutarotase